MPLSRLVHKVLDLLVVKKEALVVIAVHGRSSFGCGALVSKFSLVLWQEGSWVDIQGSKQIIFLVRVQRLECLRDVVDIALVLLGDPQLLFRPRVNRVAKVHLLLLPCLFELELKKIFSSFHVK